MTPPPPLSDSPSAAEVPLAPGFRFHPTDEELVSYYLRRRVLGRRLRIDAIAEVDLYRFEPWDLPSLSRIRSRDAQWYFFARLDRKVAGAGAGGRGGAGNRANRATPHGYWKTTGKDREVYHRGKMVGMKKTLVFHAGRAPKGDRTNWVMHEYRLADNDGPQDLPVVCRIFQKIGSGPQNGAQYGAPYMEEEWEEEEDAIENAPASGASAEMAAVTVTATAESNVEDENSQINDIVQTQVLNQPNMVPVRAEDTKKTDGSSYGDGMLSLEEILQEPVSNASVQNIGESEEQNVIDDRFSLADLSGYPGQDNSYVGQNGPVNWSNPSNGENARWPLRIYANRRHSNGTFGTEGEGFFDTGNDTIAYSGQQQACPSDHQNLYLQSNGLPAPHQADDAMVFHDASSNHKWVDGKDDYKHVDDLLYRPFENEPLFDVGDDLMAYFDATEDDFKFDVLGPVEDSTAQLPDCSSFPEKVDNMDDFTSVGISESSDVKAQDHASSSGSHENVYPDTVVPDMQTDGALDKRFVKRMGTMLDSIPAPPAFASEFPPAAGKCVGMLSAVNTSSPIRVTTGFVQLGGLTLTGSSERYPLQKNGDFSLLLSFTVESHEPTKFDGFNESAARVTNVPMVLRSGLYLFVVSAMILMLSFKVGSCIYSR